MATVISGLANIEKFFREQHQKNKAAWYCRNYVHGAFMGDRDEDYVFDALFDVPNR